ncbi:MAG: NAD(P)(+) transhydrogenase (Re/Si-specific) subunit beta, partial [Gammaproteobacteria bacterium]|nr:NAD(P)(+) transhydrogenase (Re/Si-specific) subunit beta [Gammaproteobacteria bacterium]
MSAGALTASYIVASILFILSLGGLSNQETSRRGNLYGIAGMALAVLATIASDQVDRLSWIMVAMLIGGAIGAVLAARVAMTAMPQLVAMMHSFVGLAAVLVGFANYIDPTVQHHGAEQTIHEIEVYLGVLIGAVTFTGSVVAFGKLQGFIGSKPLLLPARHWLNLLGGLACIWLAVVFVDAHSVAGGLLPLTIMTVIAFAFGLH